MSLVIYAFIPNKLVVLFLKVKAKLAIYLNSYIVIFGELIAFHLLGEHVIFLAL